MKIESALLCDAATVREGLLHILGGGVTIASRPTYPGPLKLTLALYLSGEDEDFSESITVKVVIRQDEGDAVARAELSFGKIGPKRVELLPHKVPVVIPVDRIGIPSPGLYKVEITAGNAFVELELMAQQKSIPGVTPSLGDVAPAPNAVPADT